MLPIVKKKIVLLGAGFAAFRFLKEIDNELFDVTLVSPRNHFVFTPLLPSTTVGTVEFRSIMEPVRYAFPGLEFCLASATHLDVDQKILHCQSGIDAYQFSLIYDILILAVGAISSTFGVEGVKENALFLKEISDARALRQKIIACLEQASEPGISTEERKRLLHFVVVGGGPTGVEFAAELHDFLSEDLEKAYAALKGDVRISLVDAGKYLLSSFDQTLGEYAAAHFQRKRIEVKNQCHVVKVEKEKLHLQNGEQIPYGFLAWTAGIAPTDFVQTLPFSKDKAGRLSVNEFFQINNYPAHYALGDCMALALNPLPATAQVAEQEGMYLGRYLNAQAKQKTIKPFRYKHAGMLAYIGGQRGLADLNGFKGKGFSTFIFWRSAYFTKLVSFRNKTLVLFDWCKTFLFGRDISRM